MIEILKQPNSNGKICIQTENAEVAGLLSRTGRIETTSTRVSKRKRKPITTWTIHISRNELLRIASELGDKVKHYNRSAL